MLDSMPAVLSGGERQRLPWVLLDEAFGSQESRRVLEGSWGWLSDSAPMCVQVASPWGGRAKRSPRDRHENE